MFSNNAFCLMQHAQYQVCVTIFSTGGKVQLLSNFIELHALTLAARSYALLLIGIAYHNQIMYSAHNATNT